jgi:hypothetical protein
MRLRHPVAAKEAVTRGLQVDPKHAGLIRLRRQLQ